ncbi:MAG: hypothetical protein AAF726_10770 [Planctomycetota bacterium]
MTLRTLPALALTPTFAAAQLPYLGLEFRSSPPASAAIAVPLR